MLTRYNVISVKKWSTLGRILKNGKVTNICRNIMRIKLTRVISKNFAETLKLLLWSAWLLVQMIYLVSNLWPYFKSSGLFWSWWSSNISNLSDWVITKSLITFKLWLWLASFLIKMIFVTCLNYLLSFKSLTHIS